MDSLLYELLALGIDAAITALCYRMYQLKTKHVKAITEAPNLEISHELYDQVEHAGNSIPYAVISGTVQATSNSLPSKYVPGIRGVVQELATIEKRVVWSPLLRMWTTDEECIYSCRNAVPFALAGSSGWFKSPILVQVVDSVAAAELSLTSTYNNFTPHKSTFSDIITDWFFDEHKVGILELENMLTENTPLVGIGTVALQDGNLVLKPPSSLETPFFLTPLSVNLLQEKLSTDAAFYRKLFINFSAVGFFILSYMLMKFYCSYRRKTRIKRDQLRRQEAMRQRRLDENGARDAESSVERNVPTCVVCLMYPVEIVVLECGHACLCSFCSEHIGNYCPICREAIERLVPTYLP